MKTNATRNLLSLVLVAGTALPTLGQPRAPGTPAPPPARRQTTPAPPSPAAPSTDPANPTSPTSPTQKVLPRTDAGMPAVAAREEPKWGPYLVQNTPKEVNLSVRIRVMRGNSVTQYDDRINGTSMTVTKTEPFDAMDSIAMVWPMLPRSGSAITYVDHISGVFKLDDTVINSQLRAMKNYQGGVQYARFDAPPSESKYAPRQVELALTIPATLYRTEFNERAAVAVGWPSTWPKEAAQWLAPQLYIETNFDPQTRAVLTYKDDAILAALKLAADRANISDFRRVPLVIAAKAITSYVWGHVQISAASPSRKQPFGELPPFRLSNDQAFVANDFGGVLLQSPADILLNAQGTEYDAVVLLTAMLKKAGIPAHPVIGYNSGGSDTGSRRNSFGTRSGREGRGLRAWVEFALYDEANNTINWIPIDIGKLNKTSSRPIAIDKPWRYFGTNDELNNVFPFAFHFFPPTDVVSYGAPAFWGWFVTPSAPQEAGQAVMFSAAAASKRAEDMTGTKPGERTSDSKPNKKKDDDDDRKKKRGY